MFLLSLVAIYQLCSVSPKAGRSTYIRTGVNKIMRRFGQDREKRAHPGEKLDTREGRRTLGAPVNRCVIGSFARETRCLSWVRGDSPAQFFGEGVVAIPPPDPTN